MNSALAAKGEMIRKMMGMMDWSFIVFLVFGLFETMVAKGEGRFLCLMGKNCDSSDALQTEEMVIILRTNLKD